MKVPAPERSYIACVTAGDDFFCSATCLRDRKWRPYARGTNKPGSHEIGNTVTIVLDGSF